MLTSSFSKLFSTLAERSLGSQGFLENHYLLPSSAFWLPAKLRDGFRGWISAALASGPLDPAPGLRHGTSRRFLTASWNKPLGPKVRNTVSVLLFLWSVKLVQIKSNWTQKTVSWNCWETSTHKQFVIYIPAFSNIFVVPSRCPPFLRGFYYHRLEAHGNLPGFCSLSALWGWWLQKLPRNVESSDLSDEESSPLSATVRSPFSDMT